MANSRRALLRKDNVVSLAEAREKREAAKSRPQEDSKASSENLSLTTLGKATEALNRTPALSNQSHTSDQPATAERAPREEKPGLEATVESSKKGKGNKARKVSNRTYNKEKVEAIKKAIANGSYQINHQRVADRFIEREAQL